MNVPFACSCFFPVSVELTVLEFNTMDKGATTSFLFITSTFEITEMSSNLSAVFFIKVNNKYSEVPMSIKILA